MNTTYQPQTILQAMKNLITYSCESQHVERKNFDTFHSALLKKYYEAHTAHINHQQQQLELVIPIAQGQNAQVDIQYTHLEDVLVSCLENDPSSLSFYQNMLTFYNVGIVEE